MSLFRLTWFNSSVVALLLFLLCGSATAKPRVPSDEQEVIERLPVVVTAQARELRRLRAAWHDAPENVAAGIALAEGYIEVARSESDPRYYGAAEGILAQSLLAELPRARVLRAAVLQARHAFGPALAELEAALVKAPSDAQAWLTRASIERVTGDYAAARRSCGALVRLAEPLITTTCLASVGGLSGAATASEAMLTRQIAQAPSADRQIQQWALTTLGEIAMGRGEIAETEQAFKAALALPVRNVYLKVTYADFLLQQKRPREVLNLLDDELQHDGALLRIALAAAAAKHPDQGRYVEDLTARFAAGRARGSTLHQGEEARFTLMVLDDPAAALALALANWALQREPRDARIVLEAALASRHPSAAKPVIDFLTANKTEDINLLALIAALPVAD